MEVDSGACKSVIHVTHYKKYFGKVVLKPVNIKLKVITGENVSIIGELIVAVKYRNKCFGLPLIVIECKNTFVPLLGRNWLNVLNPKWQNVLDSKVTVSNNNLNLTYSVEDTENEKCQKLVSDLKSKFYKVFDSDSNSYINKFKAELKLKENVKPIFHRAYEMPYALKPKVEVEIAKMIETGILSKVKYSEWASPIVVIPKKQSNEIRICVDFKKTLNRILDCDHCVLPLPDDIFACLEGSKIFTVIDLKGSYQQLRINDSSKELLTINTHLGLFRYNRLTYGISSAPGIFQAVMDTILAGIPKTKCYLDDILIHGSSINFWFKKISQIYLWQKICIGYRPSTVTILVRKKERYSDNCSSTYHTMGYYFISV
nr:uncharacterized protein K02A2.6-like [Onthophagus taurus]XP_022901087.1 uncharacterized protein K02A2.6-like [Onthophagus taurus]XP_022901095.1 uncharacterized protein K02A2.6-like [Onthophagus taurus]XP_022901103.1 uncharacterized protein K02A2.6-like [Onthophagus taurus]